MSAIIVVSSALGACAGAPAGTGSPERTYADSACGSCVADACRDPLRDCAGDSHCAEYLWCLGQCGVGATGDADAACEALCAQRVPSSSRDAVGAVEQCRAEGAGVYCEACGRSVVFDGEQFFHQDCAASPNTDKCTRCIEERCCDSLAACKAGECFKLKDCWSERCPADEDDPTYGPCVAGCRSEHSAGQADYERLDLCVRVLCREDCGLAPFACLQCGARFCATSMVEGLTSPACLDTPWCQYRCASDDEACLKRCTQVFGDCVRDMLPLALCEVRSCPGECG